ncbi:MAG: serine hydrolase [Pyrinomonadaceae bacterium]
MPTIKVFFSLSILAALILSLVIFQTPSATAQTNSANQLAGLWEAKHRSGPDIRGALLVRQTERGWQAEIAGQTAQAKLNAELMTFELPGGKGKYQGKFDARRTKIIGHWIQPRTFEGGTPYASPVTLTKHGQNIWRGDVLPYDDTMTFYLVLKVRDDGSVSAFLKNPERNVGVNQYRVDHIERDGEAVKLVAADKATEKGRVLAEGRYDAEREILSIDLVNRGGTFNFHRVVADEVCDFYPRGRPTETYVYAPPPALDDGWQTASLQDVGISRDGIEKFIQTLIDMPIDSVHSPELHGVLIARHGKLVLEEYFHGENRDKPHETRSAAKSLTATLIGAAINAGVPLKISSPVYQVMNGGVFPPDLDVRKKSLTIEHLLTMSSGLDCDDSDSKSPGAEPNIIDSEEILDYYKYILSLKNICEPGENAG